MLLSLESVSTSYGSTTILRDIDLTVSDGEIVGVVGRNGVGKTTLMRTIIGHLQPDSGTIEYKGEDITSESADQRARAGIGYVPQGRDVFPEMTVEENLKMGELISEQKSEKLHDEVYEYFPRLDERRTQDAGTLSGGEQQMLAIGRALVGNPDLLLLDEPSEGIQPSIVKQIAEDLTRINEDLGITTLFVEQNLEFIQSLSERCYVIETGEVRAELTHDEVQQTDRMTDYLAV